MNRNFEAIERNLSEEYTYANDLLFKYKTLNNQKIDLLCSGVNTFDTVYQDLKVATDKLLDLMLFEMKTLIKWIDDMHLKFDTLNEEDKKQYQFIYLKRLKEYQEYCACICL